MPRTAYTTATYFAPSRFFSYAHQLAELAGGRPEHVLEVGMGSGYVQKALEHVGVRVTTLDVQEGLEPDVVGSVTAIPAEDGSFDVASCCQVLEHLPFAEVPVALAELRRVASDRVLISVPDVTRDVDLAVRAPKLGRRRISVGIGRPRPMPASRSEIGHRWELGFRGSTERDLRQAFATAGVRCERSWRVPELPWHHFFVLR